MPSYTQLKGISNIGDDTLSLLVEKSVCQFFDWGFINIGGFFNTTLDKSGCYGGNESVLRLSEDPNYGTGRVWEGFRNNWIWESGLDYGTQPIQISGVYVNGTFYNSSVTGAYAHRINYPLGQVIFDSPIPSSSVVKCEYSHKYYYFGNSANTPWFKDVVYNSFRVDDSSFSQYGSGMWSILSQNRVQLPAVIFEVIPQRNFIGYQLGGGQIVDVYWRAHILANETDTRQRALDAITYQNDKTIYSIDFNRLRTENKFPLSPEGYLNSGAISYPEIVENYHWRKMTFDNIKGIEINSNSPMYRAVVVGSCEVEMYDI